MDLGSLEAAVAACTDAGRFGMIDGLVTVRTPLRRPVAIPAPSYVAPPQPVSVRDPEVV